MQAGILDLVATPEHDHLGFETWLGCSSSAYSMVVSRFYIRILYVYVMFICVYKNIYYICYMFMYVYTCMLYVDMMWI